jgi:hypothetical protein
MSTVDMSVLCCHADNPFLQTIWLLQTSHVHPRFLVHLHHARIELNFTNTSISANARNRPFVAAGSNGFHLLVIDCIGTRGDNGPVAGVGANGRGLVNVLSAIRLMFQHVQTLDQTIERSIVFTNDKTP